MLNHHKAATAGLDTRLTGSLIQYTDKAIPTVFNSLVVSQAECSVQNMSTETHPFQCQAKTHPAGKCEAVGILKKTPHQSIHSSLLFNHQAKLDFTSNTELISSIRKRKTQFYFTGCGTLVFHQNTQVHTFPLVLFCRRKLHFGKWNLCALHNQKII